MDAWDRAQAQDLRDLPHRTRLVRPGSFGTYPEKTFGSAPKAPTLDSGPLYTGEWREEIDGNDILVLPNSAKQQPVTVLASLRRAWPYVGFAFDTRNFPTSGPVNVTVGLMVQTRSGHVQLLNNVGASVQVVQAGPATPLPWLGVTGVFVGARVSLYATHDGSTSFKVKGNLWGYDDPGYGP